MANAGGFLQALGGFFGGYGQDQQIQTQRAAAAQKLAMEQAAAQQTAQLHGAQMQDYRAQAAQRIAAARRAEQEQAVWGQYGEAALNGDQAAMAQVIGAYGPDRAGQIITSLKKEPRPTRRRYDETRGVVVDEDTGEVITPQGLPPGRPVAPVMGSREWLAARRAELALESQFRAQHPGDDPKVAATRRDLKDFQSQQIRAEHDVTGTKSDIRQLLAAHPRASQPLANQRTAADSSFANQFATDQGQLTAAEQRKKRLTTSADSTQGVLTQLRAGVPAPSGIPGTGSPTGGGPPTDRAARQQQERSQFEEAKQQAKAIQDPAQRLDAMRRITAAFSDRMAKLNAGLDPDQEQ